MLKLGYKMIKKHIDWKEKFKSIYYKLEFNAIMFPTTLKCFFLSHDERLGCPENYEDPYCDRCGRTYPEDDWNVPMIKESIYWFFVELIKNIEDKIGRLK